MIDLDIEPVMFLREVFRETVLLAKRLGIEYRW